MKKPLIISLAIAGRENYPYIQKGLIKTFPVAGDCDTWIFNEYPNGITTHKEVPYLFKFDLIQRGLELGYDKIFWLDSTMRILKNPFELLGKQEKGIVAFHNLGHDLYPRYISDVAEYNLAPYYRMHVSKVKGTWGGALGFDFSKSYAHKILSNLFEQATLGSLDDGISEREGFIAHRHDQSVLSVLFDYYQIPLLEYGIIAAKKDITPKTYIQYGN